MAEGKMNVYQKMVAVRVAAGFVQKNKSAYQYKFSPEDEILAKVTGTMNDLHLLMIPMIVPGTLSIAPIELVKTKVKTDKAGTPIPYDEKSTEFLCKSDMVFRWIDADNPTDVLDIPWAMTAQQSDASFSFGGSLTYSNRMLLLKALNIATAEYGQDEYRAKQAEVEKQEEKVVVDAILSQINTVVQANTNDTNKAAFVKALKDSKLIKQGDKVSANYQLIKDVDTATKTLNLVKEFFGIKEGAVTTESKEE